MPTEQRKRGRPKNAADSAEPPVNQSLERTIDILECLASSPGLALSDVAERLALSPATVYRTLNTLAKRKLIDLEAESQTWYIGPELFRLGSAFLKRSSLTEYARPVMRRLMQLTGETANLGIERDGRVIFLSQVESQSNIRAFFQPGTRSPLYASGIGKALLAHCEPERLELLFPEETLEQFTPHTIASKAQLFNELETIRQQGWALDNQEKTEGMRCVAAVVMNHEHEAVGGISVSGPVDRMPEERLSVLGESVCAAAAELSRRLGASLTSTPCGSKARR